MIKKPTRPQSYRMARINKQLQRELSLMLEHRIKNETAKRAVITSVDCSRDLELAKVYFTTVDSAVRDNVLDELRTVKGALRSMLGEVLTLRHIPALEFFIDKAPDYGERIDGILHKLGLDGYAHEDNANEDDVYDDEEDKG